MANDLDGAGSADAVAGFATRIFGEDFSAANVVVEEEDKTIEFNGDTISPSLILLRKKILNYSTVKMLQQHFHYLSH
jgi:hypothetical protein